MENKIPYSDNLIIEMETILRKLSRAVPNEFINDLNMLKDITTRLDAIILTLKELLNERLNWCFKRMD